MEEKQMEAMDAELTLRDGDDVVIFTADSLGGNKKIISLDVCLEKLNMDDLRKEIDERMPLKNMADGYSVFMGDRNSFTLNKSQAVILRDFLTTLIEVYL
jgi:hypothetical protein